jgi:hypothetical protein
MLDAVDVEKRRIALQIIDAETAARLSVWTQTEADTVTVD